MYNIIYTLLTTWGEGWVKCSCLIYDFKLIIQHMYFTMYSIIKEHSLRKSFSWMIINELFIVKVAFAKVIKH